MSPSSTDSMADEREEDSGDNHLPNRSARIRLFVPLLLVVTLFGLALRWPQMDDSLWLDELHTSWTTIDSFRDVSLRATLGNNSPVYFWHMWLWLTCMGHSEISLRFPSLVAGLMTIGFGGWFVRSVTGQAIAGLFTASMLAIDRHALYYSLEARPYAFVALLGLVLTGLLVRLTERPTWSRRSAYWGGALLMFGLHYTTALILAAHGIALAILALRTAWVRRDLPGWGQEHAHRFQTPDTTQNNNYTIVRFLCDGLVFLPVIALAWPQLQTLAGSRQNWTFVPKQPSLWRLITLWPVLWYISLPLIYAFLILLLNRVVDVGTKHSDVGAKPSKVGATDSIGAWPQSGRSLSVAILIVACWLCAPVLIAGVATWLGWPLCERRYLCAMLPAPAILAGLVLGAGHASGRFPNLRRIAQIAVASITMIIAWHSDGPGYVKSRYGTWVQRSREDWRAAATDARFLTALRTTSHADSLHVGLDPALIETKAWLGPPHSHNQISLARYEYLNFPLTGLYRTPFGAESLVPIRWTGSEIWVASNYGKNSDEMSQAPFAAQQRLQFIVARRSRRDYRAGQALVLHCSNAPDYVAKILDISYFGSVCVAQIGPVGTQKSP